MSTFETFLVNYWPLAFSVWAVAFLIAAINCGRR